MPEAQKSYYDECPQCGASEHDIWVVDTYFSLGSHIQLEMSCFDCDYEWLEVYKFSRSEHPERVE